MTRLAEKLLTPDEFEGAMSYFSTRKGDSRGIAYDFYVLGKNAATISAKFDCSKQNVIKVVGRFATALDRYYQAQRNVGLAPAPLETAATDLAALVKQAEEALRRAQELAAQSGPTTPTKAPAAKSAVAKRVASPRPAAKKASPAGVKRTAATKTPAKTTTAKSPTAKAPARKSGAAKRVR
jgi:hypothetical protein